MKGRFDDLTGRVFGRLTVLHRIASQSRCTRWMCECSCGARHEAQANHLKNGSIKSCGCITRTEGRYAGDERYILRTILADMKKRCRNTNNKDYPRYGERGITVCREWDHFKDFAKWAYANGYKPGLCIDRIDNDGNYEPGNCRFITRSENSRKRGKKINVVISTPARLGPAKTTNPYLLQWLSVHALIQQSDPQVEDAPCSQ